MSDLRTLRRRQSARHPSSLDGDVECVEADAETECRGQYIKINERPEYVCAHHWDEFGYERDPTPY